MKVCDDRSVVTTEAPGSDLRPVATQRVLDRASSRRKAFIQRGQDVPADGLAIERRHEPLEVFLTDLMVHVVDSPVDFLSTSAIPSSSPTRARTVPPSPRQGMLWHHSEDAMEEREQGLVVGEHRPVR